MASRRSSAVTVLVAVVTSGCARNVGQDSATARDGDIRGAKPLHLVNGQAIATGIVTYPGGDRVDWNVLELPAQQAGTLEVELRWVPPRPGLQLAFDVFDEWNNLVFESSQTKKRGRTRHARLPHAKGTVFIRVYAAGRGDAGRYRLTVGFEPALDPSYLLTIEVPGPPKLPDPDVEPCDPLDFDLHNPACKDVCPAGRIPPGAWGPCLDSWRCRPPPTVDQFACWDTMECPPGAPDERIKTCRFRACPAGRVDPSNPTCPGSRVPVVGQLVGTRIEGRDVIVEIAVGTAQGVGSDWIATMVGEPNAAAPSLGGGGSIQRVFRERTSVKLEPSVTLDGDVFWMRLSPPSP